MTQLRLFIQTILKCLLLCHRYHDQLMCASKEQTVIVFNLHEQSTESDKNTIMNLYKFIVRSSRPEVFCKKGAL